MPDLETSLLQFGVTFKSQVLGDPRVILLGTRNFPSILKDEFDDTLEKLETDTMRSYNQLANMMENQDMQSIFDVFAEKMLYNLICAEGGTDNGKQIIEVTLEVFDTFVSSPASCRFMCKSTIVVQLLQAHVVKPLLLTR